MQTTTAEPIPAADAPLAHPPGYRLRRGRNWFFLGLTYASYYLCRYNLSPVAPELMRDLGLNKSQYGLINSGRDGLYAVGQMINGLFTDKLGGKQAMTIGAIATILLNLAFGLAAWSKFSLLLPLLIVIRSLDGYMQAFGAPGMIKINTAWFKRKERGTFAGIFGAMINLGAIAAGQLAKLLATGFAIPLLFFTLTVPQMNWRYVFILPSIVVAVIVVLMNLMVKNTPQEAGFHIDHEDDSPRRREPPPAGGGNGQPARGPVTLAYASVPAADDGPVRLMDVFRKIASNRVVWLVAAAYFCTGFVRRAIESWWAVYLDEVWHVGKTSALYDWFFIGLPVTATLGSLMSGYVSDLWFGGRRAPVAAFLYASQTVLCLVAIALPHGGGGSALTAVLLIIGVSMMCNSTHSLLGTAAAMDLGGPKMAGCSSGIIDSFQYYGALLSGWGLGAFFDMLSSHGDAAGKGAHLNPSVWLASMLPFGLMGTALMTYLWIKHGKTGERGA